MAYRYLNSRGVPYYLHGREVATAGGRVWTYYFLREERLGDALERVPPGHAVVERAGVAREPYLVAAPSEAAHAAERAAGTPPHVLEVVDMVRCAFGGAPPREAYWPLITLLSPRTSIRGLANLLCHLFDVDHAEAQNDAGVKGTGFGTTPEKIEAVRQRLLPCGYERWLVER